MTRRAWAGFHGSRTTPRPRPLRALLSRRVSGDRKRGPHPESPSARGGQLGGDERDCVRNRVPYLAPTIIFGVRFYRDSKRRPSGLTISRASRARRRRARFVSRATPHEHLGRSASHRFEPDAQRRIQVGCTARVGSSVRLGRPRSTRQSRWAFFVDTTLVDTWWRPAVAFGVNYAHEKCLFAGQRRKVSVTVTSV